MVKYDLLEESFELVFKVIWVDLEFYIWEEIDGDFDEFECKMEFEDL